MKERKEIRTKILMIGAVLALALLSLNGIIADPEGPSSVDITSNETKASQSAAMVNISGGYLASLNITANIQNPRWKAFLGWVNGQFTLDDASGSTIYDWSLSITDGEVYATRNSSTIQWDSIECADTADLEAENTALSHSNINDNITATFSDTTHGTFFVGANNIVADTCPTLNTYIGNSSQDTSFEEVALTDTSNIIYTTIMEDDVAGYDGNTYDFQMIVPENGSAGWNGATPYYLYVEIS